MIPATAPHNCGGGCTMKALVKDDIVVGIMPDDRPRDIRIIDEKTKQVIDPAENMNDARTIPCLRCRAHRTHMYRSRRVYYPMIQRGERGNLKTFERVT